MKLLSGTRQKVSKRIRRWMDRRTPLETESRLDYRRLYIFPSKAGFGFLVLVLAMWLLATNFENNLIFMLSFLLLAFWVVSIHFTHGTLSGLTVKPVRGESVFKGDAAAVELCFTQSRARRREQVTLCFEGGEPLMVTLNKAGDTFVTLLAPTTRRGYLEPARLTIESVYPAGLMRVWTFLRFRFDAAVYPVPVPDLSRQSSRGGSGEGHFHGTTGSDDYVGLKTFEPGESLRHVAWKQYAREQGLWSKQYGDPVNKRVWVDWDDYAGMDTEHRLSRMAWRVCECDSAGMVYGLRLPGVELLPNQGVSHRRSALRSLALYGIEEEGAADETP